jgi:purine-nucleoside phosphorylase
LALGAANPFAYLRSMHSAQDPRRLAVASDFVLAQAPPATVGVVLGSGLGRFGDTLTELVQLPYARIPTMPTAGVAGHAGNLCLGSVAGVRVACLQGRVHLYEGHEPVDVVFGVRLLHAIGCQAVLLTNAAGGIRASFAPGDLMVITDHLNLMGRNPLTGPNDPAGPRFPDLTDAYDPGVIAAAERAAQQVGVPVRKGVYAALLGPSYETPAEVRMLRALGADAVGMSTVPEVIALRHRGVRVGAMSCITNLAAGIGDQRLTHEEVSATAQLASDRFLAVLRRWVEEVGVLEGAT